MLRTHITKFVILWCDQTFTLKKKKKKTRRKSQIWMHTNHRIQTVLAIVFFVPVSTQIGSGYIDIGPLIYDMTRVRMNNYFIRRDSRAQMISRGERVGSSIWSFFLRVTVVRNWGPLSALMGRAIIHRSYDAAFVQNLITDNVEPTRVVIVGSLADRWWRFDRFISTSSHYFLSFKLEKHVFPFLQRY